MPGHVARDAPNHGAGDAAGLSCARAGDNNQADGEDSDCRFHGSRESSFVS